MLAIWLAFLIDSEGFSDMTFSRTFSLACKLMTEPVFSNCFAVIIIVDQLGAVLHNG